MLLATDPLSLLFIACFAFGALYLVLGFILGFLGDLTGGDHPGHPHHGHGHANHGHGHGGFSLWTVINPTSIVLFLVGFGLLGYTLHNTSPLQVTLILVIASGGGILISALMLMLLYRVFMQEKEIPAKDVVDRTGLLGKVSLTIPENGLGEVLYLSPGKVRKSIPARSVDGRKLERDTEVVVVNFQHGVAEVATWQSMLEEHEESFVNTSTTGESLSPLVEEPLSQYVYRQDGPKE
jgi:hypothetical protein